MATEPTEYELACLALCEAAGVEFATYHDPDLCWKWRGDGYIDELLSWHYWPSRAGTSARAFKSKEQAAVDAVEYLKLNA